MLASLKSRLVKLIQSQHFHPQWWGVLVNPFYIARKGLYQAIKPYGQLITGKTLDIGCGQKPYRSICASSEYIGLEIDLPINRACKQADVFYDGKYLPFGDEEMDSIVTHQVFEHVFHPQLFMKEIHRVLKTHGTLMMSVPFVWDEHEQPFDYARYSSFALKALLQENGFEVIALKKSVDNFSLIFQLVNAYLYKKLFTRNGYWNQLVCLFIMAPVTLLGIMMGKLFPANEDLYLDNVVIAKKVN